MSLSRRTLRFSGEPCLTLKNFLTRQPQMACYLAELYHYRLMKGLLTSVRPKCHAAKGKNYAARFRAIFQCHLARAFDTGFAFG